MPDAAHAYVQWRIDNPASVGWPQEAFMAGWAARALFPFANPRRGG